MVIKPMASETSAVMPGTYSALNARLALYQPVLSGGLSPRKALIICTPWLTPMANTRKGMSIE